MTDQPISLHEAAREVIAAANADLDYVNASHRLYSAIQGLEEALRLRRVWGSDQVEVVDGLIPAEAMS